MHLFITLQGFRQNSCYDQHRQPGGLVSKTCHGLSLMTIALVHLNGQPTLSEPEPKLWLNSG